MSSMLPGVIGGRTAIPSPNPIERASIDTRLWLLRVGDQELLAHPWLGTGVGNFGIVSVHEGLQSDTPEPVHTVPVQIAVDAGLAGVFAELLLGWSILRAIARPYPAAGPLAIVLALGALAAFDHYLWTMPPMRVLASLMLVVLAGLRGQPAIVDDVATKAAHARSCDQGRTAAETKV
jgi:hypothetical protein